MLFISVSDVVRKAMTKLPDTGNVVRAKLVMWFGEVANYVLMQPRKWNFLEDTITIAITDNQVLLPVGCKAILSMAVGGILLTPADQLDDSEAFDVDHGGNPGIPIGYTVDPAGLVTFHPGATGSCDLKFEAGLDSSYPDTDDPTIFPKEFETLFISGIRMHHYDAQGDPRFNTESGAFGNAMSILKTADNKNKPKPRHNRHGYTRTK